jgi:hypothetical protein
MMYTERNRLVRSSNVWLNSDQLNFVVTDTKILITFNKTFCNLLYENNYLV